MKTVARAVRGKPNRKVAVKISSTLSVSDLTVARSLLRPEILAAKKVNSFNIARPMPGVVPKDHSGLASDEAIVDNSVSWAYNQIINGAWAEGLMFLGYAYLSELAQRAEYRHISETIATEMTRGWIELKTKGNEDAKADKIKEIHDELERLGVRDSFRRVAEKDGFFGRAHLFIDLGQDAGEELKTSIGDGIQDDKLSKLKIKKGSLRAVKVVEPVWCYPARYNAWNPLGDNWYRPEHWFVMAQEVHRTRLLTFIGREVPDMLKPAYSFGGLALSQMAKPYVDNWLRTRQSVSDIIHSFSVFVLQTNLSAVLQGGGEELFKRIELFNNLRDNKGVMALDKEQEDFKNVAAPLGSLDKLQAQAQEQMCSVSKIPLVKFTGISPSGLNASNEGELRVFYDTILAYQETFFRPHLTTVINFIQLSKFGEVDPDIIIKFKPLWALDEKQEAEKRRIEADTDLAYTTSGILHPEEVRERIASDPDSPYKGIDADDIPETPWMDMDTEIEGGGSSPRAEGAKTESGVKKTAAKKKASGKKNAEQINQLKGVELRKALR